jgi:hypothetical protein
MALNVNLGRSRVSSWTFGAMVPPKLQFRRWERREFDVIGHHRSLSRP